MTFSPFGKGIQVSLNDLQDEMNRMFDRMWHAGISTAPLDGQKWAPLVDVMDEPTRYLLTAEVPGLNVEDIDVCYEQGELVLKGHKAAERSEDENIAFVRRERRFGSFCRRLPMPEAIDTDAITAKCHRGLLEVVLPKKEPPDRKSVRVSVGE
jgi:HSP20 family protein